MYNQVKQTLSSRKVILLLWVFLGMFTISFLSSCQDASKPASSTSGKDKSATEASKATEKSADPMENKGIGPIKNLTLSEIDDALAAEGKIVFEGKCTACHKFEGRYVGPPVGGITSKRSPEWIMNMILNPEEMVQKDPIAKALLAEYIAPMANQSLTENEARAILEYFRQYDAQL